MEREYEENAAQVEIDEINREYQDNLSRSDEDGWFYPDKDGQDEEYGSEE